MAQGHVLGMSGSLRAASLNTKLVREAVRLFDPEKVTYADLRLPLYDGDLEEEGIPEAVTRLAERLQKLEEGEDGPVESKNSQGESGRGLFGRRRRR